MIDIQALLKDPEHYRLNAKRRGVQVDIDALIASYQEKNRLIRASQLLREQQNEIAAQMKSSSLDKSQREELVQKGRELKALFAKSDQEQQAAEQAFHALLMTVPNVTHPDVPTGGESDFNVVRQYGEPKKFDFPVLDHLQLAQKHDLLDFEMGSRSTGHKFYFLKNEAVFLEMGLIRLALDKARAHGFRVVSTPDLAKNSILEGIGFAPKGPESQIYRINDHEISLIATSEITIGGAYESHIFEAKELPLLVAGLSHCFRTESGSHGRESKGLYRVHQFTKVELFAFATPEQSEQTHMKLLTIEEEIFQALELPYRTIDIASGDLGAPAYRKFDIEAWIPTRGENGDYGEVTSTSNCLDFQSRRLKIRYRDASGNISFVHTLNGTAIAAPRAILALLENGQQADGTIIMPKALHPYLPFTKIG